MGSQRNAALLLSLLVCTSALYFVVVEAADPTPIVPLTTSPPSPANASQPTSPSSTPSPSPSAAPMTQLQPNTSSTSSAAPSAVQPVAPLVTPTTSTTPVPTTPITPTPITATDKATTESLLRQSTLAQLGNAPQFMGNVHVANVMEVWGTVVAASALVQNFTSQSNMVVEGVLTASRIRARALKTDKMIVSELTSPTGTIVLNSDLILVNKNFNQPQSNTIKGTAFIAEDVVVGGVKQWKLVRHEDFNSGPAIGWSLLETSSCNGKDFFVGGHCRIATGTVKKVFDHLPPHQQVRVTGRYHFIDNWKGESAFLQLNNQYVWTDHTSPHVTHASGIDMCGSTQYAEKKMSTPVDVTMPHSDSFLEVAFGSTGSPSEDPCHRSFGVDDVMVYVK